MKQHAVQFFKFLEDTEGKGVPFRVKLLNSNKFKFTKDELDVKNDLNLKDTPIKSLPNGLRVGGSLNLYGCKLLKALPNRLLVRGSLELSHTLIQSLPKKLEVGGSLFLSNTPIKSLPNGLRVGATLSLFNTPLAKMYNEDQIRNMIESNGGYVQDYIII